MIRVYRDMWDKWSASSLSEFTVLKKEANSSLLITGIWIFSIFHRNQGNFLKSHIKLAKWIPYLISLATGTIIQACFLSVLTVCRGFLFHWSKDYENFSSKPICDVMISEWIWFLCKNLGLDWYIGCWRLFFSFCFKEPFAWRKKKMNRKSCRYFVRRNFLIKRKTQ